MIRALSNSVFLALLLCCLPLAGGDGSFQRQVKRAIDQGSTYVFQLFRRKNGVTMMIGNAGFGPWDLPGETFGLAVQKSDLRFRGVAWK